MSVARGGWKIVGLLCLSPVVPFNVLNYAFGVTRVSLRDYVIASWIGMMPGTLLYVYLGSVAGDLAGAGGRASRTPAEWAFYAVGLVATIAVTVFVTRLARRALAERVPDMSHPAAVEPWMPTTGRSWPMCTRKTGRIRGARGPQPGRDYADRRAGHGGGRPG